MRLRTQSLIRGIPVWAQCHCPGLDATYIMEWHQSVDIPLELWKASGASNHRSVATRLLNTEVLTACRFVQCKNTTSNWEFYLIQVDLIQVDFWNIFGIIETLNNVHLQTWLEPDVNSIQVTPTAVRRRSPPEMPRNLCPPTLEFATACTSLMAAFASMGSAMCYMACGMLTCAVISEQSHSAFCLQSKSAKCPAHSPEVSRGDWLESALRKAFERIECFCMFKSTIPI